MVVFCSPGEWLLLPGVVMVWEGRWDSRGFRSSNCWKHAHYSDIHLTLWWSDPVDSAEFQTFHSFIEMRDSAEESCGWRWHKLLTTTTLRFNINKMTQAHSEYWHPALGRHLEFTDSSECRYWELLHYPDQPAPRLAEGSLSDTSLAGWFTKVYPKWMVLWGSIERRPVPQKRNWLRDSYNRTTSVLFPSSLFITFSCVILYNLYDSKLYYN
jgi:hypothetical protein